MEPVVFEYRLDWRLHLALARARGGFVHISARASRMRCNQLVWTSLFLIGVLVGIWLKSLAVVVIALALLLWMIIYAYEARHLGRNSVLKMRKFLRQSGSRQIRLTVTNEGFAEIEDGKSSFASWAQVQSYFCAAGVLAIEVGPNIWSVIPTNGTSVESLVAELTHRAIPRTLPRASRAKSKA